MKSYFIGKVIENKWMIRCGMSPDNLGFKLYDRYIGIGYPVGWAIMNPKEYYRIKERKVFYDDDLDIKFWKGDKVNINNEEVIIEDTVYGLDGTITYHTDKIIKEIDLNTKEEAKEFLYGVEKVSKDTFKSNTNFNKRWWQFWK